MTVAEHNIIEQADLLHLIAHFIVSQTHRIFYNKCSLSFQVIWHNTNAKILKYLERLAVKDHVFLEHAFFMAGW